MSVPIIIIELFENKFEALFCHTEVKFLFVNRNRYDVEEEKEEYAHDDDGAKIFGPFTPTLETNRLSEAVGWITIPESRLNAPAEGPMLCSPVPDESFD
jgi:hypothetical protein